MDLNLSESKAQEAVRRWSGKQNMGGSSERMISEIVPLLYCNWVFRLLRPYSLPQVRSITISILNPLHRRNGQPSKRMNTILKGTTATVSTTMAVLYKR